MAPMIGTVKVLVRSIGSTKVGSTYVLDFDHSQDDAKDLVKALCPLIEDMNESFEEYLLDWSVVDRVDTPWEEWEVSVLRHS